MHCTLILLAILKTNALGKPAITNVKEEEQDVIYVLIYLNSLTQDVVLWIN